MPRRDDRFAVRLAGQAADLTRMTDNPAVPSGVGTRLEAMCHWCGTRGLTVKGIDRERQFAIAQCDICHQIASVEMKVLFGPDSC